MTREEARQMALELIDSEIAKHGGDKVFIACPKPGKNSWTLDEVREAVVNDTRTEGGIDFVQDVLDYCEYKKLHIQTDYEND